MDPRRLLDDPAELTELENRVLTAASAAPGEQLKQRMWSALSARLPPGGGPPGGDGGIAPGGPAAAGAAGSSGAVGGAATAGLAGGKGVAVASIAKAASIGVALGIAATTAAFTVASDRSASHATEATSTAPALGTDRARTAPRGDPAQASPAGAVPAAAGGAERSPVVGESIGPGSIAESSAAPKPIGVEADPEPRDTDPAGTPSVARFPVAPSPAVARPPEPPPAPLPSQRVAPPAVQASSSAIREESRLVAAARDALRSGNAARALALLDQVRRAFPRGTLAQEREALSIEALAASGQTKLAAERARRFLDAHPSSMHAARVRAFAGPP